MHVEISVGIVDGKICVIFAGNRTISLYILCIQKLFVNVILCGDLDNNYRLRYYPLSVHVFFRLLSARAGVSDYVTVFRGASGATVPVSPSSRESGEAACCY